MPDHPVLPCVPGPKSGQLSVGSLGTTYFVWLTRIVGGVRPTLSLPQAQVDQFRSALQSTLDVPYAIAGTQ